MSNLQDYVGQPYNKNVVKEIEDKFTPYTIRMCDNERFYIEDFWENMIRCVVNNGIITNIQFN